MRKIILLLALVSVFQSCKNDELENLEVEESFTVTEYLTMDVKKTKSTPIFAHYMPWFESPQYAEYTNTQFGDWGVHWTMNNKNPENIGTPEIARVAIIIDQKVMGILSFKPPIFLIS